MNHEDQVHKFLTYPDSLAEAKAESLQAFWGFPNNYTLGKRLTELLVRGREGEGQGQEKGSPKADGLRGVPGTLQHLPTEGRS